MKRCHMAMPPAHDTPTIFGKRVRESVLYERFEAHAKNYLQAGAEAHYGRRLAAAGAGLHGLDVREEILADFTGDALSDPAFLQVLADHNPTTFQAFVKTVVEWLRPLPPLLA